MTLNDTWTLDKLIFVAVIMFAEYGLCLRWIVHLVDRLYEKLFNDVENSQNDGEKKD